MKALAGPSVGARTSSVVVVVATILAVFFATKDSLSQHALGMRITWGKNLWWKAMEWYAWALLAKVIFKACRRFDFTYVPWRTVSAHLCCGTVAALVHCGILTTGARIEAEFLGSGLSWMALSKFVVANHFHEDLLTYAAIVTTWYALFYYGRFLEREGRAMELEGSLAQARLQALKSQLHPHFLFNTLNGIAALIYDDPKAAHRMLACLSDVLRMTLQGDGRQEVTLRFEAEFSRKYLELEQIRFGRRLTVELDISPDTLDACVPNLLLQPLLENSIKHGIAPFSGPGVIRVASWRDGAALRLQVADTGPGSSEQNLGRSGFGIGLNNTRARLEGLYGNRQTLTFEKGCPFGVVVEISIPFREMSRTENECPVKYEDSHAHR